MRMPVDTVTNMDKKQTINDLAWGLVRETEIVAAFYEFMENTPEERFDPEIHAALHAIYQMREPCEAIDLARSILFDK